MTIRVVLVLPFRLYSATVVNSKGPEQGIVKRLGRLIREIGLTHYTYRSDREISLRSALRAAAIEAGIPEELVKDVNNTVDPGDSEGETDIAGAAVPEESAPGESQSNSSAERAV